jgi:hypothetical protein
MEHIIQTKPLTDASAKLSRANLTMSNSLQLVVLVLFFHGLFS